jgi:hypothetical protein
MSVSENTLAIVSSVLFPTHPEGSLVKRRNTNSKNLPGTWIEPENERSLAALRNTIEVLRKEKERLEETNKIVRKSIEVVAEKRVVAQSKRSNKLATRTVTVGDEVYIMVAKDCPLHDDMFTTELDNSDWEWVHAY